MKSEVPTELLYYNNRELESLKVSHWKMDVSFKYVSAFDIFSNGILQLMLVIRY